MLLRALKSTARASSLGEVMILRENLRHKASVMAALERLRGHVEEPLDAEDLLGHRPSDGGTKSVTALLGMNSDASRATKTKGFIDLYRIYRVLCLFGPVRGVKLVIFMCFRGPEASYLHRRLRLELHLPLDDMGYFDLAGQQLARPGRAKSRAARLFQARSSASGGSAPTGKRTCARSIGSGLGATRRRSASSP